MKKHPHTEAWYVDFDGRNNEMVLDVTGNDPFVATITFVGYQVKRILVDCGSVVEILHWDAFRQMKLNETHLENEMPFFGFANQEVKGSITLPFIIGDGEHIVIEMVEFLAVDHPSAYIARFGCPIMCMMRMIVATFCMKKKYPSPTYLANCPKCGDILLEHFQIIGGMVDGTPPRTNVAARISPPHVVILP